MAIDKKVDDIVFHKYPDVKPVKEGKYMCVVGGITQGAVYFFNYYTIYGNGKSSFGFDEDVLAWAEITSPEEVINALYD